jgi:peptidoglycan/xylan/chitin deacetylase (PgdA/CDA1 family)
VRKTWRIALAVVVAAALWGLWGLWRLARSPETQVLGRLVPRVETSEKVVALTFDDGPVQGVLDDVLEMLRVLDVHATFFVTGSGSGNQACRRASERAEPRPSSRCP